MNRKYNRRQLIARGGAVTTAAALGRYAIDTDEALSLGRSRDGVTLQRVVFKSSDRTKLVGHLRRPPGRSLPRPAVIVPTTMTGAKDQSVVTGYAHGLARRGFVTLTFDQRGFGESGGHPRQHEDIETRMVDLSAALTYLRGLGALVDPDRIGGLGVSIAGGLLLRLAAFDPRLRAFVAIAAGLTEPHVLRDALRPEGYARALAEQARAAERFDRTGKLDYIPVVTPDGSGALFPAPDAFEYYGIQDDGSWRGASRTWQNRASVLSLRTLLVHDLRTMADLTGPRAGLLIVGADDDSTPPEWHQFVFERLSGPRRLIVMPGVRHNDLYDQEAHVSRAIDAATDWFETHLA